MKKQRIYLSTDLANVSIRSKERLEALAFAMLVKLTFVSSRVQSATVRRCKDLFGIGSTKMSRILKNGIEYGYLQRDGADIIALSIKTEKSYHIGLDFECRSFSKSNIRYKIKDIADIIRKSVLLNHISKQTSARDIKNNGKNPSSYKAYKASKKKSNMLNGCKCEGLSNKRISEVVRTSVSKSKAIIKALVYGGLVRRAERSILLCDDVKDFNFEVYNKHCLSYGFQGYAYRGKGNKVYCRISNQYEYCSNIIKFF